LARRCFICIVVLVALAVQELISELLQTNFKDKYHFKFERIGTCNGIITGTQLFAGYRTLIPALRRTLLISARVGGQMDKDHTLDLNIALSQADMPGA